MSPSLVLLLVLAPEPCAPSDLACTAREQVREAKRTTDPRERAQAFLTAARAHLALYRKTGDVAELCAARRLVPHRHTSDLGDLPRATRADIEAELARLRHHCTPPRPSSSSAPQPIGPPTPPSGEAASAESPVGASLREEEPLLDVERRPSKVLPSVTARAPVVPIVPPLAREPAALRTRPVDGGQPRAGHTSRGLLITGGLSLAAASVLGGATAYAALRVERARGEHEGLAAAANAQGYTPPDVGDMRRDLEAEALHWRRVMLGTSVATGVVTGVAVALVTAGVVKRRRSQRLALQPVLPGLLLTARF